MNLEIRKLDNLAIIDLSGQIKGADSKQLMPVIQDLLMKGFKKISLNFSSVEFIDSEFIGILVHISNIVQKSGVSFSVFNPSQDMKDLFEMTRLNQIITVFNTENEAIVSAQPVVK